MTYQDVSRRVEFPTKTLLITGEDRFLGYSFRRGARAALIEWVQFAVSFRRS